MIGIGAERSDQVPPVRSCISAWSSGAGKFIYRYGVLFIVSMRFY